MDELINALSVGFFYPKRRKRSRFKIYIIVHSYDSETIRFHFLSTKRFDRSVFTRLSKPEDDVRPSNRSHVSLPRGKCAHDGHRQMRCRNDRGGSRTFQFVSEMRCRRSFWSGILSVRFSHLRVYSSSC